MTPLERREAFFAEVSGRFECERPCGLIAAHRIRPPLLERLRLAAASYLSRSLADPSRFRMDQLSGGGSELLEEFSRQLPRIRNVTPNGIVVPKRHLILEYNLFLSAFTDVIEDLGIGDFIDCWINPANLRFKDKAVSPEQLQRSFASEHPHSEAWLPLNTSRSLWVFLPILGDCAGNTVEFFAPPREGFSEDWLLPRDSYASGREIAAQFRKVELSYQCGWLYLADVATLHGTRRTPQARPRISVDVGFIAKRPGEDETFAKEGGFSEVERPSHALMRSAGRERLFVFLDRAEDWVDTQGGKLHPSHHRKVVDFGF